MGETGKERMRSIGLEEEALKPLRTIYVARTDNLCGILHLSLAELIR